MESRLVFSTVLDGTEKEFFHKCDVPLWHSNRSARTRVRLAISSGGEEGNRPAFRVKMSIQYEVEQLADSYGVTDSFPKDFGYGEEEADIEGSPSTSDSKPRILLMGLRRSGKSSIQKVQRDVVSAASRTSLGGR